MSSSLRAGVTPVTLALILLALTAARASAQITIVSAQPDLSASTLIITGSSFAAGLRAFLFVNGVTEMVVTSQSGSQLKATLPTNVPPGSYLLAVYQPSTGQVGTFTVAIGGGNARVVDAHGRFVGPMVGQNIALVTVGADAIYLPVLPGGFQVSGSSNLLNLNSDCSGDVFSIYNPQSPIPIVQLALIGGGPSFPYGDTAWLPDYSSSPVAAPGATSWKDGLGVCNVGAIQPGTLLLRQRSIDVSGFVPPFSVKVQ